MRRRLASVLFPLAAALAATNTLAGCGPVEPFDPFVFVDYAWFEEETLELGQLELDDPLDVQAFGFRTEAVLPPGHEASFDVTAGVEVRPRWRPERGSAPSRLGVWGDLSGCGERSFGNERTLTDFEPDEFDHLDVNCLGLVNGTGMVVFSRTDWGPEGDGVITGRVEAYLEAGDFGRSTPEGLELLGISAVPTWRRTVELADQVLPIPVGMERAASEPMALSVQTEEEVAVFVSGRATVTWEGGATDAPPLWLNLINHEGRVALNWRKACGPGETHASSRPMDAEGNGYLDAARWTLHLEAEPDSDPARIGPGPLDVEIPGQVRWTVKVAVVGVGEVPPEDLVVELGPAG